jgi:hypothetical protein
MVVYMVILGLYVNHVIISVKFGDRDLRNLHLISVFNAKKLNLI